MAIRWHINTGVDRSTTVLRIDAMVDQLEKDRAARKILMSVISLNPKTPREAVEMVMGRPLSDEEWGQHGPIYETHWEECRELYDIVIKAENMLNDAYEKYLRSTDDD